jgi:lipopolysaccharide export system permease protein
MRILGFYLFRHILVGTLVVLLILTSVNIVISFITELSLLKNNYTAANAFLYVLLSTPTRMVQIFPFAILVGGVFSLGKLADNNEITIVCAAGVWIVKLVWLVIIAILPLLLTMIVLSETVAPQSTAAAHQLRELNKFGNHQDASYLANGIWRKHDNQILYLGAIKPAGKVDNVVMLEFSTDNRLSAITQAKQGTINPQGTLTLPQNQHTQFFDDKVSITTLSTPHNIDSGLDNQIMESLGTAPEYMTFYELYQQKNYLDDSGMSSRLFTNELLKKLVYVPGAILMALIAIPFVLKTGRDFGASKRIFYGVMTGIGYYATSLIAERLGLIYPDIPLLLNHLAPLGLFSLLAFWLFYKLN